MEPYLANRSEGNAIMLRAANLAGRAINIAQTTAGHAMCYKLTSLYGISHGHAASLCVRKLWPFMIENISLCTDERGAAYLMDTFSEIAKAMGCSSPIEAAENSKLYSIPWDWPFRNIQKKTWKGLKRRSIPFA